MQTKLMACFLNGSTSFLVYGLSQLLSQWTWVTLRRGTHKTPRSLRPFPLFLIQQFFVLPFTFGTFLLSQSSVGQQRARSRDIGPPSSRKLLSSLPHGPVSGLTGWRLFMSRGLSGHSLFFMLIRALWSCFFFFFCRWENNRLVSGSFFFLHWFYLDSSSFAFFRWWDDERERHGTVKLLERTNFL